MRLSFYFNGEEWWYSEISIIISYQIYSSLYYYALVFSRWAKIIFLRRQSTTDWPMKLFGDHVLLQQVGRQLWVWPLMKESPFRVYTTSSSSSATSCFLDESSKMHSVAENHKGLRRNIIGYYWQYGDSMASLCIYIIRDKIVTMYKKRGSGSLHLELCRLATSCFDIMVV